MTDNNAFAIKKLLTVFEVAPGGCGAFAPDVPGCIATGGTLDETRARFIEAVESHLAWMAEDGDVLPIPATTTVDFAGEDPEHGVSRCIVEWLQVAFPVKSSLAFTA